MTEIPLKYKKKMTEIPPRNLKMTEIPLKPKKMTKRPLKPKNDQNTP